jgi:hypothetical protein
MLSKFMQELVQQQQAKESHTMPQAKNQHSFRHEALPNLEEVSTYPLPEGFPSENSVKIKEFTRISSYKLV